MNKETVTELDTFRIGDIDMIFIIWNNLDSVEIEDFISELKAEERLEYLQSQIDLGNDDISILDVIEGERLNFKKIEVVTKIKLDKS